MADTPTVFTTPPHEEVPLWRDVRVLRWVFQIIVLILVLALIANLAQNLVDNLAEVGLNLSFEFLERPAGFAISEGPEFDARDTIWQAYLVGVQNSLRAIVIGIILATILGTIVGIARLSSNWMVSHLALWFIEVMQNTPLLVQLFFFFILVLALPRQRVDELIQIPANPISLGGIEIPVLGYFSQRGAAIPGIERLDSFGAWLPFLIAGLVAAGIAWFVRVQMRERQGRPATGQFWWALIALLIVGIIGWVIVPGRPFQITIPSLTGSGIIVNYLGGWQLSNSFQALLLGLVLYTGAFIAEVVRAGIQAVPHGQIEAATALGLKRNQQLRLIILPQAMRVIIPPLINQYLNLAKNSSLAIAVAFPDLFNVSQTIGNQTGQNVQIIMLVMGTYLAMSLSISVFMNFVNQRMQIVER